MKKQIIIGGRYFTLKRTEDSNGDVLYLHVTDVIEAIKEIGAKDENVKKHVKDGDWKCGIEKAVKYLANIVDEQNMIISRKIEIDLDMVNWDRDFNYENSVILNGDKTTIIIACESHGWLKKFIRELINEYNELI